MLIYTQMEKCRFNKRNLISQSKTGYSGAGGVGHYIPWSNLQSVQLLAAISPYLCLAGRHFNNQNTSSVYRANHTFYQIHFHIIFSNTFTLERERNFFYLHIMYFELQIQGSEKLFLLMFTLYVHECQRSAGLQMSSLWSVQVQS